MSWDKGNVARAAIGAMLSAALALGGVMPSVALADGEGGTGTGTLVINRSEDNTVEKYKAIKIFSADVGQDGGKWVATSLRWANSDTETVVKAAIGAYCSANSLGAYTGTTAQDAADFMVRYIQGTDNTTIVGPNDFANTLANYLATALIEHKVLGTEIAVNDVTATDITPTAFGATSVVSNTLTEGYYIVIADPNALTTNGAATSPILLMMGQGQNLSINEKVTIPTVQKSVVEDSAPTTTTSNADAQVGQELPFTLRGTVSGNIANFTKYYYAFTDTLPKGMDLKVSGGSNTSAIDNGDVVVKVDNTNSKTNAKAVYTLTGGYTIGYVANTTDSTIHYLTVEFDDLKTVTGTTGTSQESVTVPIDSASVVTVEYVASLNADATLGTTAGNTNSVTITYNTAPNREERGTTTPDTSTVYSYALRLVKVDKDHELDNNANTNTPLQGAVFTIQATTTDEGSTNNGKFLKTDGTFGATSLPASTNTDYSSYLFTTGTDGSFTAKGLDAGTYTIHEVTPPQNYKRIAADLVLTLTVGKDSTTLQPQSVSVTLSGGEADGVDTTSPTDGILDKGTRASYDASTGTVVLTATNQKEEELPLTGLPGITFVYVAGGAILAVSLVVIVRRRLSQND